MKQTDMRQFFQHFPTDETCLGHLFKLRSGQGHVCPIYEREAKRYRLRSKQAFSSQPRKKLYSTSPIERLNKEVKRRADVAGTFPNEASITRLIGAVLFEQNDEWRTASRYMQVEAVAQIGREETDPALSITAQPPDHDLRSFGNLHHLDGGDPR
jgi:mutator family transposase